MRIIVDSDACTGHGRCAVVAAAVYVLDDDGLNRMNESEVPSGLEDEARQGAASCPERAITLID